MNDSLQFPFEEFHILAVESTATPTPEEVRAKKVPAPKITYLDDLVAGFKHHGPQDIIQSAEMNGWLLPPEWESVLRTGDIIQVRKPRSCKGELVLEPGEVIANNIISVNGRPIEEARKRRPLSSGKPLPATSRIPFMDVLSKLPYDYAKTIAVFDQWAPSGFGCNFGLMGAPNTGKTVLVQGSFFGLALIAEEFPNVELTYAICGERGVDGNETELLLGQLFGERGIPSRVKLYLTDDSLNATQRWYVMMMGIEHARRMAEYEGVNSVLFMDGTGEMLYARTRSPKTSKMGGAPGSMTQGVGHADIEETSKILTQFGEYRAWNSSLTGFSGLLLASKNGSGKIGAVFTDEVAIRTLTGYWMTVERNPGDPYPWWDPKSNTRKLKTLLGPENYTAWTKQIVSIKSNLPDDRVMEKVIRNAIKKLREIGFAIPPEDEDFLKGASRSGS